jgi:hypothetical protein
MDLIDDKQNVEETKQPVSTTTTNQEQQLPKTVKKISKKKENKEPTNEEKQDKPQNNPRDRAKTITSSKLEVFNKQPDKVNSNVGGRKESKPINTIGNDNFKNLLSRFDKNLQGTNNNNQNNNETNVGPKKLDPNKVNFSQSTQKDLEPNMTKKESGGIQNKLNAYLEQARTRSKTVFQNQDPVLVQMKTGNEDVDDNQEEICHKEKEKDEGEEDLNISVGEDEGKVEEDVIKKEEKNVEINNELKNEKVEEKEIENKELVEVKKEINEDKKEINESNINNDLTSKENVEIKPESNDVNNNNI